MHAICISECNSIKGLRSVCVNFVQAEHPSSDISGRYIRAMHLASAADHYVHIAALDVVRQRHHPRLSMTGLTRGLQPHRAPAAKHTVAQAATAKINKPASAPGDSAMIAR